MPPVAKKEQLQLDISIPCIFQKSNWLLMLSVVFLISGHVTNLHAIANLVHVHDAPVSVSRLLQILESQNALVLGPSFI